MSKISNRLDRGDGRRQDGVTIFPFQNGKSLVWDATCSDSFAPSSLTESAVDPGYASRTAEERKRRKYASIAERYNFVPVAVETSGIIGPAATALVRDIGRRIALVTDDPQQTQFLFQRISLAIVRGNAFAITTSARRELFGGGSV